MAEFTKLVMTASGEALLAKILAGATDIEFTQIRTSTDTYTEAELEQLTVLPDIVQRRDIDSIQVVNETEVQMEGEFTNEDVTAEYTIGSIGLYAIDPDDGEILYAAASETSGRCYMQPFNNVSLSRLYLQMLVKVGNSDSIVLEVNQTGYAMKSDVDAEFSKVDEQIESITLKMDGYVEKADIVDNLETTDPDAPLSANQGKILSDLIEQANGLIATLQKKENELDSALATAQSQIATAQSDIVNINNDLSDITQPCAGAHNAIYRGKYLGSSVTSEQYAEIDAGTFNDLFIGDYWTINGVNYRIAAFDYYYNKGDTRCLTHHVVIVPDTALYNATMNDTNTTEGGYVGSLMYTTNLESAKTTIKAAFPNHVLNHRMHFSSAASGGYASAGTYYDSEVDLMCETAVYGANIFAPTNMGGTFPNNYRFDYSQYPLFAMNQQMIAIGATYWLRDIVSASSFANVSSNGVATYYYASSSFGVRPAFCIS